jgi:hypothetical protein
LTQAGLVSREFLSRHRSCSNASLEGRREQTTRLWIMMILSNWSKFKPCSWSLMLVSTLTRISWSKIVSMVASWKFQWQRSSKYQLILTRDWLQYSRSSKELARLT